MADSSTRKAGSEPVRTKAYDNWVLTAKETADGKFARF